MNSEPLKKENVFRNRNFRLVFLGALVSELGALLYNFAVSFYILQISGNDAFLQGLYLSLCGGALLEGWESAGWFSGSFDRFKALVLLSVALRLLSAVFLVRPLQNDRDGTARQLLSGVFGVFARRGKRG